MNPNSISEYHTERLSRDNLNDFVKLYAAVYGRVVSENFFLKKYNTAYTGLEYFGFIAYNNDRLPISYYGVIPCFIAFNHSVIPAAQSADTMTHPQYRYKGLFVILAKMCLELCYNSGIRIIFGFPNQYSLPGFINNLNWERVGTLDLFIIPVNTLPLERLSRKFSFSHFLYIKYTKQVLKKYLRGQQGITNSATSEGYAAVFRDEQYLHYKTYSNTRVIQIKKSLLWIQINNGLIIGDMQLTTDDFEGIIAELKKIAARLGTQQILFHTSQHTRLHTLFTEKYKAIPSFPVIYKDLNSGIPLDKIKFTFADIDIF